MILQKFKNFESLQMKLLPKQELSPYLPKWWFITDL